MENNMQREFLKKLLEVEQCSISELSRNVEIGRTSLSRLVNHGEKLNAENWNKLIEAYPQYHPNYDEESGKIILEKKLVGSVEKLNIEIRPATKEEIKGIKKTPKIIQKALEKVHEDHKNLKEAIIKQFKTRDEHRHRNLNCPASRYHMKVQQKDLLRARPTCPISQKPMMLKEEIKQYKAMNDQGKKQFTEKLLNDNEFSKQSILKNLKGE